MINIIQDCKNPEILVITPLLPGHQISRETKITIKRNDVPFKWISVTDNHNIPTNIQHGINEDKSNAKYIFPLDNDIILGRGMLDKLYKKLSIQKPFMAFCYASFEFKGVINHKFPALPYDIKRLMSSNYISSNSLIRKNAILESGGFVVDDKYKRLLDWAMWLKLFYNGFIGINCPEASFIAISKNDDVSTGSRIDYAIKYNRVQRDFVVPIEEKIKNLITAQKM